MTDLAKPNPLAAHLSNSQMRRGGSLSRFAYVILLLALGMRLASSGTANLSFLVLAGYAMLGRAHVVQALALSCLFTVINPGIAPEAAGASVGRFVVIAFAAISLLLRIRQAEDVLRVSRTVYATLALGTFLIVHSLLFSPYPDVSIFKAASWTMVVATLLSAWEGLDSEARSRLEGQFFFGLSAVMLFSLPLAFTSSGYLVNGTGFQGALNHPQAFGSMAAIVGAWVAGRLLAGTLPRWWDMALLAICIGSVVMSEARTGGLALFLGLACAGLAPRWMTKMPVRRMQGLGSWRLHLLILIMGFGLILAGGTLSDRLGAFIQKRSESAGLLDAADKSRGEFVDAMLVNIRSEPLTGIGFGIASDPALMTVDRDPVLGLPVGAAIEKGVLPIAVPEELGIFGFLIVGAWMWFLVRRGAGAGIAEFAVLATLLSTNLGEFTFFSPGGIGLFSLILAAWAITAKDRHETVHQEKSHVRA